MIFWSEPRIEIEIVTKKITTMFLNLGKFEPERSYKRGSYEKKKSNLSLTIFNNFVSWFLQMPEVTSTEADGEITALSEKVTSPAERCLEKLREIQARLKKNPPPTMPLVMNTFQELLGRFWYTQFERIKGALLFYIFTDECCTSHYSIL